MSGAHAEIVMYFGKYKGWKLGAVPNSYLSYLLRQDWFEDSYPDLLEPVEDESNWRREQGVVVED